MRLAQGSGWVLLMGMCAGCGGAPTPEAQTAYAVQTSSSSNASEFAARTQPAPGHSGKLVTAVLHPVVEVLVVPGARVKKDQPLIHMDDDEPKAEVRNKEATVQELRKSLERLKAEPRDAEQEEARATLESAHVTAQETRRDFERLAPLWQQGAISELRHHTAQAALARAEADERAAQARLKRLLKRPFTLEVAELEARIAGAVAAVESAKAELEHFMIVAPIDGVLTSLDVSLGQVTRPGTSAWGEVLDIRQLDARLDLSPQNLRDLKVGQGAEVFEESAPEKVWPGKIVFIGLAAEPATGRVPVLVRIENPDEKVRCYINVRVRLGR